MDLGEPAPSLSGSFRGDGSELNKIPTSAIADDITRIAECNATASVSNGTTLEVSVDTNIDGILSASLYRGDGGGLYNVPADAIGDIDKLKSGSAVAIISPNQGLRVNVNTDIAGTLDVTGNTTLDNNLTVANDATITNDLTVGGTITSTELITTFISSSVIYASGSNVFGDESTDSHQFTGSVLIKDSVVIPVFSSEPSGGQIGQLYYNDTDTNIYR